MGIRRLMGVCGMKGFFMILTIMLTVLLSGCGSEVATFASGFGTGATAAIIEANETIEGLQADVAVIQAKRDELKAQVETVETIIKADPQVFLNTVDPKLGAEFNKLIIESKALVDAGKEIAIKEGKFDWTSLAWVLLAAMGGGTGVNLYKNSGTTPTKKDPPA